jgi:hypothetical protein
VRLRELGYFFLGRSLRPLRFPLGCSSPSCPGAVRWYPAQPLRGVRSGSTFPLSSPGLRRSLGPRSVSLLSFPASHAVRGSPVSVPRVSVVRSWFFRSRGPGRFILSAAAHGCPFPAGPAPGAGLPRFWSVSAAATASVSSVAQEYNRSRE